MRWLIDSDVLIEGEREDPAFLFWLAQEKGEVATADIVRAEFLLGVHAVANTAKRVRAEVFYRDNVQTLACLPCETPDYETAARMAGEARRNGKAKPSLVDGLIVAIAVRSGATVAIRNLSDFKAMGCPCANPLEDPS